MCTHTRTHTHLQATVWRVDYCWDKDVIVGGLLTRFLQHLHTRGRHTTLTPQGGSTTPTHIALTYPFGGLKHSTVKGIPLDLPPNECQRVTARHALQQGALHGELVTGGNHCAGETGGIQDGAQVTHSSSVGQPAAAKGLRGRAVPRGASIGNEA